MKNKSKILENPPNLIQRFTYFSLFLITWWIVSQFSFVNSLILPSPIDVVNSIGDIGFKLIFHSIATCGRALMGLLIGTLAGIFLGLLVRYNPVSKVIIEPFLDAARPVPAIALLPFFILIFGFSEAGRICLVMLAVMVIIAVATVEATETMPETWFRFPIVAGFSRKRIFLKVICPGIIPLLIGPIRIALSLSFTIVIASEFMGAQIGLGYLINAARVNLATPTIVLCVILLGILAQLSDSLLYSIMTKHSNWYQGTRTVFHSEEDST